MEFRLEHLTLRTVTDDDLDEVARMWNFGKGEISLEEATKAIDRMHENHKQNHRHKIEHLCLAVFDNHKREMEDKFIEPVTLLCALKC